MKIISKVKKDFRLRKGMAFLYETISNKKIVNLRSFYLFANVFVSDTLANGEGDKNERY